MYFFKLFNHFGVFLNSLHHQFYICFGRVSSGNSGQGKSRTAKGNSGQESEIAISAFLYYLYQGRLSFW